ncbi:hypothetical protein QLQ86_12260 [Halomonas sp. LR5S13]|uniref:hypothetical protein n=1 Tax=Halomonas rhizosphaerae TaxID=3043296 RepID=UPI0024A92CD5|nr:hypothetical protein [Halomonas rhizosphaerae]MDI5921564.1 hypothetical protein [Halomonas rhizosphaerae]
MARLTAFPSGVDGQEHFRVVTRSAIMAEAPSGFERWDGADDDAFTAYGMVVLMPFAALWKNGSNTGFIR